MRTGHADQNLAVMRHLALNLLKQERSAKVGIKAKRKKAGWDFDYLLKVLSQCNAMRLPWAPDALTSSAQREYVECDQCR